MMKKPGNLSKFRRKNYYGYNNPETKTKTDQT